MPTRTAFSLAIAAALTGTAIAQQATIRPWPGTTPSNPPTPPGFIQPTQYTYPSNLGGDQTANAVKNAVAVTSPTPPANSAPATLGSASAMGWTTSGQAGTSATPIHTLYYHKETQAGARTARPLEAPKPLGGIRQVQGLADQPPPSPGRAMDSFRPNREILFQLDSEDEFVKRENAIRQREDANLPKDQQRPAILFPPLESVVKEPFPGRYFQPSLEQIEPNYVCYGRLFCEDRNTERYGWSMGPLQPALSTWKFLGDVSSLPYKFFSFPRLDYDSNAGLCLPGDPVPMMAYPPQISATGLIAQACVDVALVAIIR